MFLNYTEFAVQLNFEKEIDFDIYPGFILHSILGEQLHKLYCVNKSEKNCDACLFNSTCGYSLLYETILNKNNDVVPGRIRGCHPFILKLKSQERKNLIFSILLLGNFYKYYSPIIEALRQAGEYGFGKNRIKFTISPLSDRLDTKSFEFNLDCINRKEVDYLITLKSPLRIVVKNELIKNLTYCDFMSAANRRIRQIIMFYGETTTDELNQQYVFSDVNLQNLKTEYLKLSRWSSRQKRVEPLGGITGEFYLKGNISVFEEKLLTGAGIFSIGKSTNFGFGQIEYIDKMEE